MTFKKKLLLASLIMMLPLLFVGGLSIWTSQHIHSALQDLEPKYIQTLMLGEIEATVNRQLKEISDYLTEGDTDAREELIKFHQILAEKIEDLKKLTPPSGEARDIEDLEILYLQIDKETQEILSLYDRGEKEKAIELMEKVLEQTTLEAFENIIQKLIWVSKQASITALQTIKRIESDSWLVLIIGILCSLIFGIIAATFISINISRPIEELKKATEIFGEGHLEYEIPLWTRDEIGALISSFNKMAKKLKEFQEHLTQTNLDLQIKIKELELAQNQLIQSEKLASIGQMSATVAHGMRNPLANIRAVAQVSLRELNSNNGNLEENLRDIISQVDRLEKRISHLLDFTRPFPFNPFKENINILLGHLISTFQNQFAGRGVCLETDLQEDLPEIFLDPVQMEQILSEIISNALEAMPTGGNLFIRSRLVLSESSHPDPGEAYIQIEFQDTGEGIPEEALPRVFDPFFTTKVDGSGLGLAFARKVVERHGGQIHIESKYRHGTHVKILLPVKS
ncbi:MAG TPA: ATP-binding protein [Candidatus Limnocylindrales bacterium]|nr:ATP-binding protein [Candidatus Limnocylindrales bacterium]